MNGCHKKRCYGRLQGQKLYSQFCFDHTCERTVSIEDGYHCKMARERGAKYCIEHMTCAARGCREKGYYDGVAFPWFCPSHRCTKAGCKSGIHDLLQKRCPSHVECAAAGCVSPPHADADSSYCKQHTCKVDACPNQARQHNNRCAEHPLARPPSAGRCFCGTRKLHPSHAFCLNHGCRLPGCAGERFEAGGTLCVVHKCTFDTCFAPITRPDDPNSIFCAAHACRVVGCVYSRKNPSFYCGNHRDQSPAREKTDTCPAGSCANRGADGKGSLCAAHACSVKQCGLMARYEGGGFCGEKHACIREGCRHGRLSVHYGGGEEGEMDLCLKHDRERERERGKRMATGTEDVARERDEWRVRYQNLRADFEALQGRGNRMMQATVEDSEDSGLW